MRSRITAIVVGAAVLIGGYAVVVAPPHSDYDITSFSGTYDAANGTATACDAAIDNAYYGQEPVAGTHPVLIYLRGSLGSANQNDAQVLIQTAAKRGFVAVSADYIDDDYDLQNDAGSKLQAQCIFDTDRPNSVASIACARTRADCNKGIVVAGHSQGGGYAILAADYEPKVVADLNMGWAGALIGQNESSLNAPPLGNRKLPNSALRVMDGETETGNRTDLIERTGENCTSALDCLTADGHGFYFVPNADMADGSADHCWFDTGGCTTTASTEWQTNPPTKPWHLRAMLDWFDSKTGD